MRNARPTLDQPIPAGPVIILVEPQLAENIGMVARAMANFGLSELRLVKPRDGWPSGSGLPKGAHQAASGAVHVLEQATLFADLPSAIGDLHYVLATTARPRDQSRRVFVPAEAMEHVPARIADGQRVGILFGRERVGLLNDEVSLADAILTFPVNPAFASLNLAQAVLLVAYEWFKTVTGGAVPFETGTRSPPATREAIISFFTYLEDELARSGFFPPDKRPVMVRNLRDLFHRLDMTDQDIRTLRGAFVALVQGRKSTHRTPPPPVGDGDDGM